MPPPAACGEYALGGASVIVRPGPASPAGRAGFVCRSEAWPAGAPAAAQAASVESSPARQAADVAADDRRRVTARASTAASSRPSSAGRSRRVRARLRGGREREGGDPADAGGMRRTSHRGSARRRGCTSAQPRALRRPRGRRAR